MLIDAVATHARRMPDALACLDLESGLRWSYRELDAAINRTANWLVAVLGPASGERVATVSRNSAAMLVLNLAIERAGAIFVPCNWRLSESEIEAILLDAQPKIVFRDTEFLTEQRQLRAYELSELFTLSAACPTDEPRAHRCPTEPSLLLYTSGTSGRPKGVMLSQSNALWSQMAFNLGNNVGHGSVFLCDMPLFHTAGLLVNARAPLLAGGAVLISRGFDADKTLQRLSDPQLRITHYFSVPQMAAMLANHAHFDPARLRHLQVYATGGAPNPRAQVERFVEAGIPMADGYGMTEAGSVSGMPVLDIDSLRCKAGSSGVLYFGLQAKVVDDNGNVLPAGVPGELWLRGPGITSGYWNQPDKTAEAFRDGWFVTGDIARFDEDGYLYIVDRKKDMFISGGENIYSSEVESVIAEIPGVQTVAVVGVPDAEWGETGAAFIVTAPGQTLTARRIESYCRANLAAYKVPKQIRFVETLPVTSTGKLQKQKLRDALKNALT